MSPRGLRLPQRLASVTTPDKILRMHKDGMGTPAYLPNVATQGWAWPGQRGPLSPKLKSFLPEDILSEPGWSFCPGNRSNLDVFGTRQWRERQSHPSMLSRVSPWPPRLSGGTSAGIRELHEPADASRIHEKGSSRALGLGSSLPSRLPSADDLPRCLRRYLGS